MATVVFKKPERLMWVKSVRCACVYVCALNGDETVGVEDNSELNHGIYKRVNSVYFILVSTTNSRMNNPIVLAFGGSFVGSAAVDCGKVMRR